MKHLILAAAALLGISTAHAGPLPLFEYRVTTVTTTDLGTLGGLNSAAADINDFGFIVGWAEDASRVKKAFIYYGIIEPMDLLFGPTATASEATGINNTRQIVGSVTIDGVMHGFQKNSSGSAFLLNDRSPFGDRMGSRPRAISDSGLVVGERDFIDAGFYSEATFWRDAGRFLSLEGDTFPFSSYVYDVNDAGDSVGQERDRDTMRRWDRGAFSVRIPVPAATTSCVYSDGYAYGINNVGTVVGYVGCWDRVHPMGTRRAMHWNGRNLNSSDLGLLPTGTYSVADDVNEADFVVGYGNRISTEPTLSREWAFIFHRDFGMVALTRPSWMLWNGHCHAVALNERNATTGVIQVVGTCDTESGPRAVRWNVTVVLRSTVPPGSFP